MIILLTLLILVLSGHTRSRYLEFRFANKSF